MKVNYPTDRKYAQKDFTNNFRNIKNRPSWPYRKNHEKPPDFFFAALRKFADGRKIFKIGKIKHI